MPRPLLPSSDRRVEEHARLWLSASVHGEQEGVDDRQRLKRAPALLDRASQHRERERIGAEAVHAHIAERYLVRRGVRAAGTAALPAARPLLLQLLDPALQPRNLHLLRVELRR